MGDWGPDSFFTCGDFAPVSRHVSAAVAPARRIKCKKDEKRGGGNIEECRLRRRFPDKKDVWDRTFRGLFYFCVVWCYVVSLRCGFLVRALAVPSAACLCCHWHSRCAVCAASRVPSAARSCCLHCCSLHVAWPRRFLSILALGRGTGPPDLLWLRCVALRFAGIPARSLLRTPPLHQSRLLREGSSPRPGWHRCLPVE